MTLQERFRRDFAAWRTDLPPAWRDAFAGVELGFDAVDPAVEIGEDEPIWPQAGHAGSGNPLAAVNALLGREPVRWCDLPRGFPAS